MSPGVQGERGRSGATTSATARAAMIRPSSLRSASAGRSAAASAEGVPATWAATSRKFNVRGHLPRRASVRRREPDAGSSYKYFFEHARHGYWQGIVGWYVVRVADPAQAVAAITTRSTESSPTRRRDAHPDRVERSRASFMKQMGNIEFLIVAIGTIVVLHAAAA